MRSPVRLEMDESVRLVFRLHPIAKASQGPAIEHIGGAVVPRCSSFIHQATTQCRSYTGCGGNVVFEDEIGP